jgi:transglutaminase-like putative cysteine protease
MTWWWNRLTPRVGWFPFGLLLVLDLLAGYSTYRAEWSDGLIVAVRAIMIGSVLAYLLARPLGLPDWAAHPVASLFGTLSVLWILQDLLSDELGGWRDKLAFLWLRWERWFAAVQDGQPRDDYYLFLLLIAVTHFLVGYLSSWLLVRHDHAWVSVLLPSIVILINAGYSRAVSSLFVAIMIVLDLLIVGRVTFMQRLWRWRARGFPHASGIAWQALWVLSWLSVALLLVGWIVPLSTHSPRVSALLQPTSRPWNEVRDTLAEWFPSVRGPGGTRGGVGGFASFGDRFEIGGPLRLSDEPVLLVSGLEAPYLTVRTYDLYTGRGWRSSAVPALDPETSTPPSSPTDQSVSQPAPLLEFASGEEMPQDRSIALERQTLAYHVEVLQARGAALPITGTPVSVSVPVRALYGWTNGNDWRTIELESTPEEQIPRELRPLAQLLRATVFRPPAEEASATPTPDPYADRAWYWSFMRGSPALPELDTLMNHLAARGIEVTFWWEAGADDSFRIVRVAYRGRLPDYADLEALFPTEGVSRGLSYDLVTTVSRATPEQLRAAGRGNGDTVDSGNLEATVYGVYPRDLYRRYTQLPESVTERTRQLALALAAGKSNAYDVAATIEAFVRQRIAYNEAAPTPSGIDAVDTVLFVRPEGYCTFYASAMAVLLRAVGIPARIAVGYYPGESNGEMGGIVYRDRNAHAWVEVFFPGYGWIPFEPTASRPPLLRGSIAEQADWLPMDPILGANLPTDERFGLRLSELDRSEGAGAVGTAAATNQSRASSSRIALVVSLAVLGMLVLAVTLWWFWGSWRLSPAGRLYLRLCRLGRVAGVPLRESMTPLEYAWEIGRRFPGTRRAAEMIAFLYTREQYGQRLASEQELRIAARGWRESIRPRLLRAIVRWQKPLGMDESHAWTMRGRWERQY